MPTNYNGLRKTVEVLDAIAEKVRALKLGPEFGNEKAFQTVAIFNVADIDAGIRSFIAARDRVAFIIFDGDEFDDSEESEGAELKLKLTRKFDVLVSDRVIAQDRTKALLGSKEHPGALALKDLVQEELSGLLFANPKGVYVKCRGSETAVLSDAKQKEHPGRVGVLIQFDARGGLLSKELDRASIK